MLRCVNVPDLARFDWPAVRVTGKLLITRCQRWAQPGAEETLRRRPSAGADTELGRPHAGVTSAVGVFAQVQPAALNGPAGVRRSFWDALQSDPTPRGKAAEQPTSRGKGELVEPQYVFGAVARTTVTVISEPRGAIQATSLRHSPSLRFNPSKNHKEKGKNQRARS